MTLGRIAPGGGTLRAHFADQRVFLDRAEEADHRGRSGRHPVVGPPGVPKVLHRPALILLGVGQGHCGRDPVTKVNRIYEGDLQAGVQSGRGDQGMLLRPRTPQKR